MCLPESVYIASHGEGIGGGGGGSVCLFLTDCTFCLAILSVEAYDTYFSCCSWYF